jgi:hypothetical protein
MFHRSSEQQTDDISPRQTYEVSGLGSERSDFNFVAKRMSCSARSTNECSDLKGAAIESITTRPMLCRMSKLSSPSTLAMSGFVQRILTKTQAAELSDNGQFLDLLSTLLKRKNHNSFRSIERTTATTF